MMTTLSNFDMFSVAVVVRRSLQSSSLHIFKYTYTYTIIYMYDSIIYLYGVR